MVIGNILTTKAVIGRSINRHKNVCFNNYTFIHDTKIKPKQHNLWLASNSYPSQLHSINPRQLSSTYQTKQLSIHTKVAELNLRQAQDSGGL